MLTKHDLRPMPMPGNFHAAGQPAVIDGSTAHQLACAGVAIVPADLTTAETVADRIEAAGNPTRAAAILRAFGAPKKVEAAVAKADVVVKQDEPPSDDGDKAVEDAITIADRVKAAGDSMPKLSSIASDVGLDVDKRWHSTRLRSEILQHVSKETAKP